MEKFAEYFKMHKRPKPTVVESIRRKSTILRTRTKDVLKKKIFRMIDRVQWVD